MATSDLITSVLAMPGFARQLRKLTVESVARQFPTLVVQETLFTGKHDWPYLLTCATHRSSHSADRAFHGRGAEGQRCFSPVR